MKLGELFSDAEFVSKSDHEVGACVPLDYGMPDVDVLRWWNGEGRIPGWPATAGAIIMPRALAGHVQIQATALVLSDDPKGSFMDAVSKLHPTPPPCEIHIGMHCDIHADAVIGKAGFGYHKGKRVPHIGGVHIGHEVEIGAHTCVDRGTLGATVIGDNTKVDNLVHIAHNVRIGYRCTIVAGTVIGGSAVIGDDVYIGINASIKNKVRIGNGATIGMGAVVLRDVPAGETWVGNPARKLEKTPSQ